MTPEKLNTAFEYLNQSPLRAGFIIAAWAFQSADFDFSKARRMTANEMRIHYQVSI